MLAQIRDHESKLVAEREVGSIYGLAVFLSDHDLYITKSQLLEDLQWPAVTYFKGE